MSTIPSPFLPQAVPAGAAGGDLAGNYPSPTVAKASNGLAVTGVESVSTNLVVGSTTALGDNGVGELQLANVTSTPTTNPTGGLTLFATSGAAHPLKARLPSSAVQSLIDSFTQITGSNPTFTLAAQTATGLSLAVAANAIYVVRAHVIIQNTTGTTTPSWTGPAGATMQWCDTTTSTDYSSTIGATNNPFAASASTRMIFLEGLLDTAGTSGNLTLTLGVSAGTTTLFIGSNLRLERFD